MNTYKEPSGYGPPFDETDLRFRGAKLSASKLANKSIWTDNLNTTIRSKRWKQLFEPPLPNPGGVDSYQCKRYHFLLDNEDEDGEFDFMSDTEMKRKVPVPDVGEAMHAYYADLKNKIT